MIFLRTLAILILLTLPALADEVVMVGFGAGGSCNLGYTSVGGTQEDMGVGTAFPYTASCGGTLTSAYIYHDNTQTDRAKLCIYNKNSDVPPDSGDDKVACSDAVSCNTDGGWCSTSFSSGTIVEGNAYYVVIVPDADAPTNFFTVYDSVSGGYYDGFSYASPPDNLDGTWTARSRKHSAYATVVY